MANRNDSDARQHETLPGPGPGPSASGGGNARPVEQMVDAAIERIARERSAADRAAGDRAGSKGTERGVARNAPIELARRSSGEASLARRDSQVPGRVPTRLRWKGHEVSEEFRQYAERVARGEELPPFEGRVLAEPHPAFPWGEATVEEPEPRKRGSHPLLWGAAVLVLGGLGWSVALKLEGAGAQDPLETTFAATPLAATPLVEPEPGLTPPDVVETPAVVASEPTTPEPDPALAPAASTAPAAPVAELPRPVPAPTPEARGASPAPAPAAAARPSVAVDLARPGALQEAIGAALAGRGAAAPAPAAAGTAAAAPSPAGKPVRDDEFGIMASVNTAPVTAPPAAAPPAAPPAAAGAKSNGNVGDVARAGQPSGSGVRKEPGSESSAKGSLLVETPSF